MNSISHDQWVATLNDQGGDPCPGVVVEDEFVFAQVTRERHAGVPMNLQQLPLPPWCIFTGRIHLRHPASGGLLAIRSGDELLCTLLSLWESRTSGLPWYDPGCRQRMTVGDRTCR